MKYIKNRKKPEKKYASITFYVLNKKKNRGLKRLIKAIDIWKESNMVLDMGSLEINKSSCLKLCFSPFYNLLRSKNPPLWYQRLLMKALYEIYNSWFVELSKLNKPFYLKLWIMKNDFMSSQVVVALDEKIDFYSSIFMQSPINSKTSLNMVLDRFPFLDTMFIVPLLHLYTLNSLDDSLSQKEIRKLNKISIKIIEKEDGSTTFVYPLDTVLLSSL